MLHNSNNHEQSPAIGTILDDYFAEYALGPEHRLHIAMHMWRQLSPAERLQRQQEASVIAGTDLELGAEYTQDVLLLQYVNQRAVMQADRASVLLETVNPIVSDAAASVRRPAA